MSEPIRYDRLHQYAQENRLDYNELCRVVRVAAAPAIKDSNRYRWLRDRPGLSVFTGERIRFRPFDCPHEIEVGQIGTTDLDEAIDAQLAHGVALPRTPLTDEAIEKAWWSLGTEPDGSNLAGGTNLEGWTRAIRWAEQQHGIAGVDVRSCTCYPDDTRPEVCQRKFALSECRAAAGLPDLFPPGGNAGVKASDGEGS